MRKNRLVVKQIAVCIETHDLAASPEPRVDGQYSLLSDRRGEQKLPKVLYENLD